MKYFLLSSGQQLVQLPDGKLHVLHTSNPTVTSATTTTSGTPVASSRPSPQQVTVVKTPSKGNTGKQVLIVITVPSLFLIFLFLKKLRFSYVFSF